MTLIGVTGGIGAGKSTICTIIEILGYKIYDCDKRAKELMNDSDELKTEIIASFGTKAYQNDKLNREYISQLVFNDRSFLEKLNSIVHPAVNRDIKKWCEINDGDTLLFIESAILIESGVIKMMDYSINIYAPLETRIKRVCKRDNTSKDSIIKRISNQLSDEIRSKECNFTIISDDKTSVLLQLFTILNKIINLSRSKKK